MREGIDDAVGEAVGEAAVGGVIGDAVGQEDVVAVHVEEGGRRRALRPAPSSDEPLRSPPPLTAPSAAS